jgi:hypothetical protein
VRQGRRDVLLTTLIDLLVQVVFVFIIIMIVRAAAQARDANGGNGGYRLDQAWQMLKDARGSHDRDPVEVTKEVLTELDAQAKRVEELQARNTELQKSLGEQLASAKRSEGRAPGKPRCLDDRRVMFALRFTLNTDGTLTPVALPDWQVVQVWMTGVMATDESSMPFDRPLTPEEFGQAFGTLARNVREKRDCTLMAEYRLSPGILGETSDRSTRLIAQHFRPQRDSRER